MKPSPSDGLHALKSGSPPAAPVLDLPWNRAHFGAWCVVSSPLVLSMDLAGPYLAEVIPIVTNPEAIQINQEWAGHPGMLLSSVDPTQDRSRPGTSSNGYVEVVGALSSLGTKPLHIANLTIPAAEHWCNINQACTCFTAETGNHSNPEEIHQVYFKNNQFSNGTSAPQQKHLSNPRADPFSCFAFAAPILCSSCTFYE